MWYDDFWSLKIKMSPRSAFGEVSCYSEHYTSRINILYSATYIHISVNSAVELLSRDTALIRNHKSTLFACFKALPVKRFIRVLFWRALFLSLYTWRARIKKPVKQRLITELSYLLRYTVNTRFLKYVFLELFCCSVSHCSNKHTIKIIGWPFLCQWANVQNQQGIK